MASNSDPSKTAMEPDSPLGVAERAVATAEGPASRWNAKRIVYPMHNPFLVATAERTASRWNEENRQVNLTLY